MILGEGGVVMIVGQFKWDARYHIVIYLHVVVDQLMGDGMGDVRWNLPKAQTVLQTVSFNRGVLGVDAGLHVPEEVVDLFHLPVLGNSVGSPLCDNLRIFEGGRLRRRTLGLQPFSQGCGVSLESGLHLFILRSRN